MKLAPTEHSEQVALFNWAKRMESRHPQLALMFAIPNGGKRHIGTAKKLKASGAKAGVPDIFLPVPHGEKHGLWIELKVGKNKATTAQKMWLSNLASEGYETAVCYGFHEAMTTIVDYLGLELA
tara:strand:- start:24 stop:395 length:372 start_codon:yes stop_codon:yes gene_type:complete